MGRYIIKATKDRDLYMEWSAIVDAPTFIGNRAEILDYLKHEHGHSFDAVHKHHERLRRADEAGTSALRDPMAPGYTGPLDGEWADTGLIVGQRGWLPRDRFAEFLDAYAVDPEKACTLLDPFDDDPTEE
jgi:hypothetical protein